MRVGNIGMAAILALALAAPARAAEDARARLVVSTSWLAEHLKDSDLVLLHVGDKAEYDKAHIPGARFISTRDVAASDPAPDALHLEMPLADVLRQRLESFGISDTSRILVYYGNDWISPTTRIVFTLQYAGLGDRTMLLDGGQPAWMREGREVTAEAPASKNGSLSPLKTQPLIVDAAYVKAHAGQTGTAVVDSRDRKFYTGESAGGAGDKPHRRGHIVGAVSVPFDTLVDGRGAVRSTAELQAAFTAAGVKSDDTVVTYCHIGQQATATLLAARLAGHKVLLYDGSFEDWSRREEYPVTEGAASK